MTRQPKYWEVPADTPASTCNGPNCGKEIYWIKTLAKKNLAIDCHAGAGCLPPTLMRPGSGVAHFGTCVDVEYFRRPRPTAPDAA